MSHSLTRLPPATVVGRCWLWVLSWCPRQPISALGVLASALGFLLGSEEVPFSSGESSSALGWSYLALGGPHRSSFTLVASLSVLVSPWPSWGSWGLSRSALGFLGPGRCLEGSPGWFGTTNNRGREGRCDGGGG